MKRMVLLWCLLIVIVLGVSFIVPTWSLSINSWTVNALILLSLLLLIELGLVYHQSRSPDLNAILKQSQSNLHHYQQETHYISRSPQEDK